MNRGIVIVHLESINEDIFFREVRSERFKNFEKLIDKSIYYDNYYSTATSTIMTISDLLFGCRNACEHSSSLGDFRLDRMSEYLQYLHNESYSLDFNIFPVDADGFDVENIKKIIKPMGIVNQYHDHEKFIGDSIKSIKSEGNSLTYVFDWSSLNKNDFSGKSIGLEEMSKLRFKGIDYTIGRIMTAIEDVITYKDILLIVYGDHGDELYGYSLKNGFTHAIEPYYSVVKTPLFMFTNNNEPSTNHSLVCTTDLMRMIENWIKNQEINSGIDNKVIYSRNLFANQRNMFIRKSYMITDGDYLLIASKSGLEMYFTRYACFRYINLLNFFKFNNKGKIVEKRSIRNIESGHFNSYIVDSILEIEKRFDYLYQLLKDELGIMMSEFNIYLNSSLRIDRVNYDYGLLLGVIEKLTKDSIEKCMRIIKG